MTESEWLDCDDPERMIRFLTDRPQQSAASSHRNPRHPGDRKLRLFACNVVRAQRSDHPELLEATRAAEKWAEGGRKTCYEYDMNVDEARDAAMYAGGEDWGHGNCTVRTTSVMKADILRDMVDPFTVIERRYLHPGGGNVYSRSRNPGPGSGERLLTVDTRWFTPQVTSLALAAYRHRRRNGTLMEDRLKALADGLEDAGCDSDDILFHLRGEAGCGSCQGVGYFYPHPNSLVREKCPDCDDGMAKAPPHYRGCWAVDLCLGK